MTGGAWWADPWWWVFGACAGVAGVYFTLAVLVWISYGTGWDDE